MSCLAMHRNADPWPHPFIHAAKFIAAGMSGNMNKGITVLDDPDALINELVFDFENRFLVTGNSARGKDHCIAGRQGDGFHLVASELCQCSARLALATG